MFDKMKQLYDMQKKAKELQKQMESIQVEKASSDGSLKVSVNGTLRVQDIQMAPTWLTPDRKANLEKSLRDLINEAFADVQQQSSAQAAQLMKGLNIPGLG